MNSTMTKSEIRTVLRFVNRHLDKVPRDYDEELGKHVETALNSVEEAQARLDAVEGESMRAPQSFKEDSMTKRNVQTTPETRRQKLTWTCPDCGEDVPPIEIPHWTSDGVRLIRRQDCDCPASQKRREEKEREERLRRLAVVREDWLYDSRLDPKLKFGSFEGNADALSRAKKYARGMLQGRPNWLWLDGPAGTGKRHLASAIGLAVIQYSESDPKVRYVDWPNLLSRLSAERSDPHEREARWALRAAEDSGLLILDRIALIPRFSWAVRRTVNLLRLRAREKRPTVLVSSVPFGEGGTSVLGTLMTKGGSEMKLLLDEWGAVIREQIEKQGILIRIGR